MSEDFNHSRANMRNYRKWDMCFGLTSSGNSSCYLGFNVVHHNVYVKCFHQISSTEFKLYIQGFCCTLCPALYLNYCYKEDNHCSVIFASRNSKHTLFPVPSWGFINVLFFNHCKLRLNRNKMKIIISNSPITPILHVHLALHGTKGPVKFNMMLACHRKNSGWFGFFLNPLSRETLSLLNCLQRGYAT